MKPRAGSLCSGAGMLDKAIEEVFGAVTVWQAETNPAASKVLARHWPGVPNFDDITQIAGPQHVGETDDAYFARMVKEWRARAALVDIIGGGIPCQPFSNAGLRAGSADERHLWPTGALPCITALLPPVVVLENVPGLLTIEHGTVFGRVLADLADLGYTVAWSTVGACRVGACHHRHRVFMLAVRSADVRVPSVEPVAFRCGAAWVPSQEVLFGGVKAVKWPASALLRNGSVWPLPSDTCGDGGLPLLPSPAARDGDGRGEGTPEYWRRRREELGRENGLPLGAAVILLPEGASGGDRFGLFATAVRRHEALFGGPAPDPTDLRTNGNPRLSALLPEWMMGLPRGWITADVAMTDVAAVNDAIRMAGNGVFRPAVARAVPLLPTFPAAVALLNRQAVSS